MGAQPAAKTVNPQKFNDAVANIWTGWVGVLAVLKIQFAKTVTLGNAIGDKIYVSANQYVEPSVMAMVPEDYKQWVPVCLKWVCKSVAISIAWWIQRVLSAFHSAIRGGLLFGRQVVNYAHENGYIGKSANETYTDEVIGWCIAGVGL